jgi:hypothetical protein
MKDAIEKAVDDLIEDGVLDALNTHLARSKEHIASLRMRKGETENAWMDRKYASNEHDISARNILIYVCLHVYAEMLEEQAQEAADITQNWCEEIPETLSIHNTVDPYAYELQNAKRLREIVQLFIDRGYNDPDKIAALCEGMKDVVPLLRRITCDIPERVRTTYAMLIKDK